MVLEDDGAKHVKGGGGSTSASEDLSPFVGREPDLFVACGVEDEKDGCGVRGARAVEVVDELEHLFASDNNGSELHPPTLVTAAWCERQ